VAIKNWIGFSSQDLDRWKEIAFKFLRWFYDKFKANLITKEDIGNKFPVLWFYLVYSLFLIILFTNNILIKDAIS
jgi:hypothetical protein